MRITRYLLPILLLLPGITACAQDAAEQAMQANEQATQAAQQAQQAAQQATDQASQAAMQAMQTAADPGCNCPTWAAIPKLSLKPGTYPPSTIVRLTDATRGAHIYYTTDGWTPTRHSTRYTGPITLSQTTTLQAVAIARGYRTSLVAVATYIVPETATNAPLPPLLPLTAAITVAKNTPIRLAFTAAIDSQTAQVGDKLPLALAQDLAVHGYRIAPRGTPAIGAITEVDRTGAGGAPGLVKFKVTALNLPGTTIPLRGRETKQGAVPVNTIRALIFIPVIGGPAALMTHGKSAEIAPGATVTAYVTEDTVVPPPTVAHAARE